MVQFSYDLQTTYAHKIRVALLLALLLTATVVSLASASDAPPVQSSDALYTPMASWPACGFNCSAGDVTMTNLYLADASGNPLPACTPGQPVTAYLWGSFLNNSNAFRYAIVVLADIYQNGTQTGSLQTGGVAGACGGDTIPTGSVFTSSLTAVSWTCGQSMELRNLVVTWDTNSSTCSSFFGSPQCTNRGTKCHAETSYTVRPLIEAEFTAANACVGDPITFTNTSKGGVAPISYNWAFGDGNTSTVTSPTHTYATAGSYNVNLSMQDSSAPPVTDNQTHQVTILPTPTADFNSTLSSFNSQTMTMDFISTTQLPNGCTPTYLWDFGDGITSTLASPAHEFARRAQGYTVTLTVTCGSCANTKTSQALVPLGVALADFTAEQVGNQILVRWETATEINNRGFNVFRGTTSSAWNEQLNSFLIPSQSPGSGTGYTYEWPDQIGLENNMVYWYWVQDVDVNGVTSLHGPASVVFTTPTAVDVRQMQAHSSTSATPMPWITSVFASVMAALLAVRRRRV